MKQINREKLLFVTGMLEGLSYTIEDVGTGEALNCIIEQIDAVLEAEKEGDHAC